MDRYDLVVNTYFSRVFYLMFYNLGAHVLSLYQSEADIYKWK